MAELCSSCGAELFAGQQYCRRCGAPTRKFSTAEVPTQILPEARGGPPPHEHAAAPGAGPTQTTPLAPRPTGDTGYESRYAGPQPPAHHTGRVPPAPAAGAASRRGWLWALLAVLVASVAISALVARQFAVHWAAKKTANAPPRVVKVNAPKAPMPDAALPPPLVLRGEADGEPLDEEGAVVTSDKTVITETFALGEDGRLSIVNTAGNITVEGWDEEEAEIRITKRGGTREDRAAARIIRSDEDDRLTLRTAEGASGRLHEVRYEIKLPRAVRQLEITARDADVRVANVAGGLSVRVDRGDIELVNVGGAASTHTMKGHTRVVLADAEPDDAQVFSGVNGDIELMLAHGTSAQIKAQTVDGDIVADRGLKLDMQKRAAGWHAAGTVGRGGEPILVKTVSGNIKIRG